MIKILQMPKLCFLLISSMPSAMIPGDSPVDNSFRRIFYMGLAIMPFNALAICCWLPLFEITTLTIRATIVLDLIAMSYLGFKCYKSKTGARYDLLSIIIPNLMALLFSVRSAYFNCFNFAITIIVILSVIIFTVFAIFILFCRPTLFEHSPLCRRDRLLVGILLMIAILAFFIAVIYMSSSYSTLFIEIFTANRIYTLYFSDFRPRLNLRRVLVPHEPQLITTLDCIILASFLFLIAYRILHAIGYRIFFIVVGPPCLIACLFAILQWCLEKNRTPNPHHPKLVKSSRQRT